jgi:hypothetical protein
MKLVDNMYAFKLEEFKSIPSHPWVYWITPGLQKLFETLPKLGDIAQPRQGLATADNFRFLRFWWEVGTEKIAFGCQSRVEAEETGKKWFPYMKGGSFCRWYGNQEYVVNWWKDGAEIQNLGIESGKIASRPQNTEFYFQKGVTYSALTVANFNARLSPGGFIFDVAGSSLFPKDIYLVLAVMNSSFTAYALKILNPTVNFQVGDIARIPLTNQSSEHIRTLVSQAINLAKTESIEDEITYDFIAPNWTNSLAKTLQALSQRQSESTQIEQEINKEVYHLYGIGEEDREAIEAELNTGNLGLDEETEDNTEIEETTATETANLSSVELSLRWISYAVGIVLGRFKIGIPNTLGKGNFIPELAEKLRQIKDNDGIATLERNHPDDLASKVEQALELMLGENHAIEVIQTALGEKQDTLTLLRNYLDKDFFKYHIQKYRKRPIYWQLQSAKKNYSIFMYHEKITPDTLPLIRGSRYLGGKINYTQSQINELHNQIKTAEARQKKALEKELEKLENLLNELEIFDQRLATILNVQNDRGETVGWRLEIDDGIILNLAPLYELIPAWKTEPKKYWEKLQAGDYDWSYTAMRYYPNRVQEKCKKNKSLAIAHNCLDVYSRSQESGISTPLDNRQE